MTTTQTIWTAGLDDKGTNPAIVVKVDNIGKADNANNQMNFAYQVELKRPIDHPNKGGEDTLPITFNVSAKAGNDIIAVAEQGKNVVVVVEDDIPRQDNVVHNIQVAHDTISFGNLTAGFTDTTYKVELPSTEQNATSMLLGTNVTVNYNDGVTRQLTESTNVLSENTQRDNDNLDDSLAWGWNGNDRRTAGYDLVDNAQLSSTSLTKITDTFTLGTFTHRNNSINSQYGVLEKTSLAVQFDITINGEKVKTPLVKFGLTHLETTNDRNNLQDTPSNDFVIVKNSDQVIQVGDTAYLLKIEGAVKQGTNADINKEILTAFNNLTTQSWSVSQGLAGFLDDDRKINLLNNNLLQDGKQISIAEFANAVGLAQNDANVKQVYDLWTQLYTATATNGKSVANVNNIANATTATQALFNKVNSLTLPDATKVNFIRTILDGTILTTTEAQDNNFDVKANLSPITNPLDLSTNVDIQGKIHIGGDTKGVDVTWLAKKANGALEEGITEVIMKTKAGAVTQDINQAYTFEIKSKYGVMTAHRDGSYSFKAVSNIADIVKAGEKGTFAFKYAYVDNDGDQAISDIRFDFDGLTANQMSEARPYTDQGSLEQHKNDYYVGSTKAEVINVGRGEDTLVGNGGKDTLIGGTGNDVLFYGKNATIDGDGYDSFNGKSYAYSAEEIATDSNNFDTLSLINWVELEGTTQKQVDFSAIQSSTIKNIEAIDMTNDFAQSLKITASSVLSMTDGRNQLFIDGDASDTVQIQNMTKAGTYNKEVNGESKVYDMYTGNGATLYVLQDINDQII
ncbi:hypothetical protein [Moraxella boevrei]|uniref:hypothetical protein n=1 Tax=Faucicola boevrei TaxID=346665 RepID=UPI0037358600